MYLHIIFKNNSGTDFLLYSLCPFMQFGMTKLNVKIEKND